LSKSKIAMLSFIIYSSAAHGFTSFVTLRNASVHRQAVAVQPDKIEKSDRSQSSGAELGACP
jgi:hypothetical protein